jgi:hypothetical protein
MTLKQQQQQQELDNKFADGFDSWDGQRCTRHTWPSSIFSSPTVVFLFFFFFLFPSTAFQGECDVLPSKIFRSDYVVV